MKWRSAVAGFVLTLAVLGAGYAVLVAGLSRIDLDPAQIGEPRSAQSHAIAATAGLLAWSGDDPALGKVEPELVPTTRALREQTAKSGAKAAAMTFLRLVTIRDSQPEGALVAFQSGAAPAGDEGPADLALEAALKRLNVRIANGRAHVDARKAALVARLYAAADACELEGRALSTLAENGGVLVTSSMEARLYQARGAAFAWQALLQASMEDAPDLYAAYGLEAKVPLAALHDLVGQQPLFLFNGGPRWPFAPAHFSSASALFTRAAYGARALAASLERS